MNKTELVAAVAAKAELSKKDAEAAVNAVFDSVKDALAEGDKVSLIVFCKLILFWLFRVSFLGTLFLFS